MLNYYLVLFISGLMWIKDDRHGIMIRSKVHNVTKHHFLIAHTMVMCIIGAISALTLMTIVVPTFDIPFNTVMFNVAFLLIIQTTAAVILGFFIGITSQLEFEFILKVCFVVFPALFLSENFWPINNDNILAQTLSCMYPLKQTTVAFRALIFEKFDITEYKVYMGYMSNIAYSAVLLTISFVWLKIKK